MRSGAGLACGEIIEYAKRTFDLVVQVGGHWFIGALEILSLSTPHSGAAGYLETVGLARHSADPPARMIAIGRHTAVVLCGGSRIIRLQSIHDRFGHGIWRAALVMLVGVDIAPGAAPCVGRDKCGRRMFCADAIRDSPCLQACEQRRLRRNQILPRVGCGARSAASACLI